MQSLYADTNYAGVGKSVATQQRAAERRESHVLCPAWKDILRDGGDLGKWPIEIGFLRKSRGTIAHSLAERYTFPNAV
jgi:hypothetical protein